LRAFVHSARWRQTSWERARAGDEHWLSLNVCARFFNALRTSAYLSKGPRHQNSACATSWKGGRWATPRDTHMWRSLSDNARPLR
jgi:hypothetical protein